MNKEDGTELSPEIELAETVLKSSATIYKHYWVLLLQSICNHLHVSKCVATWRFDFFKQTFLEIVCNSHDWLVHCTCTSL